MSAVPFAATAPALVVVGIMMISSFKEIDWSDFNEAVPAFFAGIFMALCYSISYGIAAGFIFYCIVKICKKEGQGAFIPSSGLHRSVHSELRAARRSSHADACRVTHTSTGQNTYKNRVASRTGDNPVFLFPVPPEYNQAAPPSPPAPCTACIL